MTATLPQIFELTLLALGVLLWVVALARGRALEWFTAPSQLPPWVPLWSELLVFALSVCVASLFTVQAAVVLFKIDTTIEPMPARTVLINGYAMQLAWLGVALGFRALGMLRMAPGATRAVPASIAGLTAFLLAVPAIASVQLFWEWVLRVLKIKAEPQVAIDLIRQAETFAELIPWILLVVVVVPVAEEVLFRHVLYRFLAARAPDALAMVVSSALFGIVHVAAASVFPLTVLGVALCLAYRYTGRLITPIVMHATFNLTTLLLVKLGA
jgi:membrane protease YdiL (CAAX protease family)